MRHFATVPQTIARMGKWIYQAMYKSYLMFFKVEGLLAVAGWPGAAVKDFNRFWAPRFLAEVPLELIDHVMPWLKGLKAAVAALGSSASPSMRSVAEACEYLAVVSIQDALELASKYPDHPVHQHLRNHPVFE